MSFAQMEGLENRRLFAVVAVKNEVLLLNGKDSFEDDFIVRLSADKKSVIVNYEGKDRKTIALADFKSVKAVGGSADDEFEFVNALAGKTVTIDTGAGNDEVRIGPGKGKFIVNLGADSDKLYSVLDYTVDPSEMVVAAAKVRANGGDGPDQLHARGVLEGGAGIDGLYGSKWKDFLYGGDDIDFIDGEEGNDIIFGGAGNDELHGDEGKDSVFGDAGNDLITGGQGDDSLFGNAGDDNMFGDSPTGDETGNDTLYGGKGEDVLHTNAGDPNLEKKFGGEYKDLEELIAKFARKAKKAV